MQEKQETKQRQQTFVPQLAVSKRFARYQKEEKKGIMKSEVKEDKEYEMLVAAFKRYLGLPELYSSDMYDTATEILRPVPYSSKTIERFAALLPWDLGDSLLDFEQRVLRTFRPPLGKFMSAAINKCPEDDFKITVYDGFFPWWIGYRNCGSFTLEGDACDDSFTLMKEGKVIVRGNGSYFANMMEGGVIIIENDADHFGKGMTGGEIRVEGEIGTIGDVVHGKVYHRGILIVDK